MRPFHSAGFIQPRLWLSALVVAVVLSACQPPAAKPTPVPPTPIPTMPAASPASGATTGEVQPSSAPTTSTATDVQPSEPLTEDEARPPTNLRIPAIDLDVAVTPMRWRVAEVNGERTTVWVLPEDAAGWHPNSAGAGAAGNVVISGYQLLGEAVFAPIALGDVAVDQEIRLADAEGRVFVYRVTDVSEPLPISTDLQEEFELAARYTSQTGDARLTLISGWPDFSSTHRVMVTAVFVGVVR